jgi:hypothetical protein
LALKVRLSKKEALTYLRFLTMQQPLPGFEYRTTFTTIKSDFPNHDSVPADLAKISPKPPKGEDWQLAQAVTVVTDKGPSVLYFWERTMRERTA